MMLFLRQERGSTLVIVLLTLTLLMTVGLVIINHSLTTAKQSKQTESVNRATHLAEMGVIYVQKSIEQYVKTNPPQGDLSQYVTDMFTEIEQQISNIQVDSKHPSRQFQLKNVDVNIDQDQGIVKAAVKINGKDERKEKELTAMFKISSLNDTPTENPPTKDDWLNNSSDYWLEESPDDWITEPIAYPEKPKSGETFNEWIDWKEKQENFDDNLILNNGGRIQNSDLSTWDFYGNNWIEVKNTILNLDGVTVLNNGGYFKNSELTAVELYSKNFIELDHSLLTINGLSVFNNSAKLENSELSTENFYIRNWLDMKNSELFINGFAILNNGGEAKGSKIEIEKIYSNNFVKIDNSELTVGIFGKFDYLEIGQNSNITFNKDLFVSNQLNHSNGEATLHVCNNMVVKGGVNYNGNLFAGRNVLIEDKLITKNGTFLVGGSVYLKEGINIESGNTEFLVGGDFIINQKYSFSSIKTANDLIVYGDLILLDVPKYQHYLFNLKNNLFLAGDVLVYYHGEEDPVKNPQDVFSSPVIKEYGNHDKKGAIIYHYPVEELPKIKIEGCPRQDDDQEPNPNPNPQEPIVEIVDVQYS